MISDEQMNQLEKLKELFDMDILSKEEFEAKKKRILEGGDNAETTAAPKTEPIKNNSEKQPAPTTAAPVKPVNTPNQGGEYADYKAGAAAQTPAGTEQTQSKKQDDSAVTMTLPNTNPGGSNVAGPAGKPPKKKLNIKMIIGIVAAVLVLLIAVAAIGGSGDDSDYDDSGEEVTTEEETEESEPVVESIDAEYSGDTDKGTVLDEDNTGITVTATYDDGSSEEVYDWSVDESKTLRAGKKSTITINYEGQTCQLTVKCTSVNKKQFKRSCKKIAYSALARNPKKHDGKNIRIYGQIIQVVEDGSDTVNFRVGTKNSGYGSYYDDVFLVEYTYGPNESRLLEDDMVTMWGTYGGTYTYESTGGGDITVPLLYAKYVKRG